MTNHSIESDVEIRLPEQLCCVTVAKCLGI